MKLFTIAIGAGVGYPRRQRGRPKQDLGRPEASSAVPLGEVARGQSHRRGEPALRPASEVRHRRRARHVSRDRSLSDRLASHGTTIHQGGEGDAAAGEQRLSAVLVRACGGCFDDRMAALYVQPWPPAPIVTERLVMRAPQASDRDGFISLLTSPLARQFLGGPIAPTDAEAATSAPRWSNTWLLRGAFPGREHLPGHHRAEPPRPRAPWSPGVGRPRARDLLRVWPRPLGARLRHRGGEGRPGLGGSHSAGPPRGRVYPGCEHRIHRAAAADRVSRAPAVRRVRCRAVALAPFTHVSGEPVIPLTLDAIACRYRREGGHRGPKTGEGPTWSRRGAW